MANEKILVNGKVMTQADYLALLSQAKEATKAYKETPAFKAECEARKKLSEKRVEYVTKFIEFGKKLGLDIREIGSVGYSVYLASRKDE
jgi:hypothetical protein